MLKIALRGDQDNTIHTISSCLKWVRALRMNIQINQKSGLSIALFICKVLCLKIWKMDEVLKAVIKIVNFIWSRALNYHSFISFLKDLKSEFEDSFTEFHWLSYHKILKSFYLLLEEIIVFLKMKYEKMKIYWL